jgi:hypothetical protein
MATTTLFPNGFQSSNNTLILNWTRASGSWSSAASDSTSWGYVDDDDFGATEADGHDARGLALGDNDTATELLTLDDVPPDFLNATNVTLTVCAKQLGTYGNDSFSLLTKIEGPGVVLAASTSGGVAQNMLSYSGVIWAPSTPSYTGADYVYSYVNTSSSLAGKDKWNAAYLSITLTDTTSMGSDAASVILTSLRVNITYTAVIDWYKSPRREINRRRDTLSKNMGFY